MFEIMLYVPSAIRLYFRLQRINIHTKTNQYTRHAANKHVRCISALQEVQGKFDNFYFDTAMALSHIVLYMHQI